MIPILKTWIGPFRYYFLVQLTHFLVYILRVSLYSLEASEAAAAAYATIPADYILGADDLHFLLRLILFCCNINWLLNSIEL